ncbi:asparagine--tRNA ligase [archaeon BMS3Abin17]|nr:asparagine--tRNA ligase [archaeon BMS3Abin17]HDZ61100.1 asparagine--tRNA ligase [Candidatus Pacearchaeota archaeon]
MKGPYRANEDKSISYNGNNVFPVIEDISSKKVPINEIENRVKQFKKEDMWKHITQINHRINMSTNEYFDNIGACFVPLPLTTKMISSPGAVYGKEAIDYTTDVCPITLKWFDLEDSAFLSESSQIYLELALTPKELKHVYSIYNSFRKEKADATHLSEFHHIEYEGKVSQEDNERIALGLTKKIIKDLLNKNEKDLSHFLTKRKLKSLDNFAANIGRIPQLKFREALDILYEETKDDVYKEFSLKNFGSWEEIKLTEILGNMVLIKEFPLLEVPFYHAQVDCKKPEVANNSDVIWPGYREFIGSGHRIRSKKELQDKAKIFNLPLKDYSPYFQTRKFEDYEVTSGFGVGLERMIQGILEMPFIWSASQFPRVDKTLKP